MAIFPCFVGLLVFAAACAIAALPRPASFEKIPRANPQRIASQMDAPIPDSVSKALRIIRPTASGNTVILLAMIKIEKEINKIDIKLKSENFTQNAPAEIIDEQKSRHKEYVLSKEKIEMAIKSLG